MLPLLLKTLQWTIHQAIFLPLFTQLLKSMTYTTALHVLSTPLVTPLATLINHSFVPVPLFFRLPRNFPRQHIECFREIKARNLLDVTFVQRIGEVREDTVLV